MSRNIGESVSVGAINHIMDPSTGALSPPARAMADYSSSPHLAAIETLLQSLQPPRWQESILGAVDPDRAKRGGQLFAQNCAECHGIRAIAGSPHDEWSVRVLPVDTIGTDQGRP